MNYRTFGKTDFKPSALGLGCMRFPILNSDSSKIDEEKTIQLIRYAIDNGVNYVDTAYPYHNGNSETVVGKALQDGYREKVHLATKMPVWLVNDFSDFDKYFNEQLAKLNTDHIDMYLLHALSKERIDKMEKLNVFKFLDKIKNEGKVKYVGFSFHDNLEAFKHIVDLYDWDFCQIQYNYLDENYQAGVEGLKYASSKGLGVVIMEPLKGGTLAKEPPQKVKNIFDSAATKMTPAAWSFTWLWNQPEVSVVLSGMNEISQLDENIKTSDTITPNSMSNYDKDVIKEVQLTYKKLTKIGCTACEYCLPCPKGVNIPKNFKVYNQAHLYGDFEGCKKEYASIPDTAKASNCVECGSCETKCPQHLNIRELLKTVKNEF